MPKRKKRRQNDSSRAMQQALDHYECALRNLEDADEPAALEALDFAEVFLERAQDDDVRRGLVAEVSLARGALLEVADPSNARLATPAGGRQRSGGAAGGAPRVALRRRRAACGRCWSAAAAAADEEEARGDAAELLGRFLAERGRVHEVHELAELGYDRTFSRKALTNALHARPCDDAPARLFDDALPSKALAALRRALRPAARYWRETDYGSPAVGFFSFTHRLDSLKDTALEGVLGAIWRAAVKALPEARNATYVEWWAHTRRRGDGHALHYDSVPGLVDEAPPRHPLASTVTFLEASVGGPTIIFDQTVANKRSTRAWEAPARPNRLLVFDGSLLHGVLPGGRGQGRRTTFMANFWRDDPRARRADKENAAPTSCFLRPLRLAGDFGERVGDVEIRCEGCAAPVRRDRRRDAEEAPSRRALLRRTFLTVWRQLVQARPAARTRTRPAPRCRTAERTGGAGAGPVLLRRRRERRGRRNADAWLRVHRSSRRRRVHHVARFTTGASATSASRVDYSDSGSEDDEMLARDAAARRIEVDLTPLAGVPGVAVGTAPRSRCGRRRARDIRGPRRGPCQAHLAAGRERGHPWAAAQAR